jgi:hypothetical protein
VDWNVQHVQDAIDALLQVIVPSRDIEPDKRLKTPVIENIPQLKRKEKSIYKSTDLWTAYDDALFLKYCPNPRDKCYHAMSRDSAAGVTKAPLSMSQGLGQLIYFD